MKEKKDEEGEEEGEEEDEEGEGEGEEEYDQIQKPDRTERALEISRDAVTEISGIWTPAAEKRT